jgi:hypothetical protein
MFERLQSEILVLDIDFDGKVIAAEKLTCAAGDVSRQIDYDNDTIIGKFDESQAIYCSNTGFGAAMVKSMYPDMMFFNQKFPPRIVGKSTLEVAIERAYHLWYRVNIERRKSSFILYDECVWFGGNSKILPGVYGEVLENQMADPEVHDRLVNFFGDNGTMECVLVVINEDGKCTVLVATRAGVELELFDKEHSKLAPPHVISYWEASLVRRHVNVATDPHFRLSMMDLDGMKFDSSRDFPLHPRWSVLKALRHHWDIFSRKNTSGECMTMLID